MGIAYFPEERCIMCGEVIEEGRQVCLRCEKAIRQKPDLNTNTSPKRHRGVLTHLLCRNGE